LTPERLEVNKVQKLIPDLRDKTKYVIHHKTLKLCLDLCLKLKKIHREISFHEETWMKQYINLHTQLRTNAKSEFEKDFFKLVNNPVFGKTMENIRKRVNAGLITNAKCAKKLVSKPSFKRFIMFDERLVAVHMKKTRLVFREPVKLVIGIINISKTLMYDFHYNYMRKKYSENCRLLMTDTDSLMYEIKSEDFLET